LTRFDAPCEQVAATLDVDDVIMDGEVIAADETGRPQFYDLLRCARKPAYVAFDLLWPDGVDLRSLPSERASGGACKESFPRFTGHCRSPLRSGQRTAVFELMHSYDLEGIVAKRLGDPYNPAPQLVQKRVVHRKRRKCRDHFRREPVQLFQCHGEPVPSAMLQTSRSKPG